MSEQPKHREQRIRLRIEGSPVKFEGTVVQARPDGKRIRVVFDGPREDAVLYAYGDTKMVSDMKTVEGKPTEDIHLMATGLWWEVL